MKRDTGVGCIELGSGANYFLPVQEKDPNEINPDKSLGRVVRRRRIMNKKDLENLVLTVLIALTCPLVLPLIIEEVRP